MVSPTYSGWLAAFFKIVIGRTYYSNMSIENMILIHIIPALECEIFLWLALFQDCWRFSTRVDMLKKSIVFTTFSL